MYMLKIITATQSVFSKESTIFVILITKTSEKTSEGGAGKHQSMVKNQKEE